MRALALIAIALPLALAACGSYEERVVYVQPTQATATAPQPTTVVVPPGSSAKICPVGTVC